MSILEMLLAVSLRLSLMLLARVKLSKMLVCWLADDWCIKGGQQCLHMQARLLKHEEVGEATE